MRSVSAVSVDSVLIARRATASGHRQRVGRVGCLPQVGFEHLERRLVLAAMLEPLDERPQPVGERVEEQLLFAALEMEVEGAAGHVRCGGDLGHRGPGVSLLGE